MNEWETEVNLQKQPIHVSVLLQILSPKLMTCSLQLPPARVCLVTGPRQSACD